MVDYKPNMKGNVKKRSGIADNANTTDHSLGNRARVNGLAGQVLA